MGYGTACCTFIDVSVELVMVKGATKGELTLRALLIKWMGMHWTWWDRGTRASTVWRMHLVISTWTRRWRMLHIRPRGYKTNVMDRQTT